jgi:hypothetical protein
MTEHPLRMRRPLMGPFLFSRGESVKTEEQKSIHHNLESLRME